MKKKNIHVAIHHRFAHVAMIIEQVCTFFLLKRQLAISRGSGLQ